MAVLLPLCGAYWAIGGATAHAQNKWVTFSRASSDKITKRLQLEPASPQERVSALHKLFADAGCGTRIFEQTVPDSAATIWCSTRGTSESEILIVAPVEYGAKSTDEATLHWGDLTMLTLLADSVGPVLTRHRLVFMALGGKNGEDGAAEYLKTLPPEEKKKIDAVIAFDDLGRALPLFDSRAIKTHNMVLDQAPNGTGKALGRTTRTPAGPAAEQQNWQPDKMPLTHSIPIAASAVSTDVPSRWEGMASNVTKPFDREEIPAITFTSPTSVVTRTIPMLNDKPYSIVDPRKKLDAKAYDQTYMFLCAYLLYLDRDLGQSLPAPSEKMAETIVATGNATAGNIPPGAAPNTEPAPVAAASAPNVNGAESPAAPVTAAALTPTPPVPVDTKTAPPLQSTPVIPVFRALTRLVQLDVVALDRSGRPIQDLRKQDFTVLQDGKPQPLSVFEFHRGNEAAAAQPAAVAPEKPLKTFSNTPGTGSDEAKTIILFDMMNTSSQDQQTARHQLLKLAEQLPKGQPVSLFALTENLVMVQPFTTDPDQIVLAINNLLLHPSHVLDTEAERQQEVGDITNAVMQSTAGASGASGAAVADFNADMIARQLKGAKTVESFRVQQRVLFTMDAFAALARSLAGYPGRKNVIWLSGTFPTEVLGDPGARDNPWQLDQNYQQDLARTMALLTEARVAVYPIDIRGIQIRGVEITTSGSQSSAFVGPNTSTEGAISNDKGSNLLADQTFTFAGERETMEGVAHQTGGRAFLTNDFAKAIGSAMQDGSNYYTLAYTPDKDERATYHKIVVKLDRSGVDLAYRRGYFSQPAAATSQTGQAALRGALQPGMPPSTMLLFTASVNPPDGTRKSLEIHYVVNASNITLADSDRGAKHVVLDFVAVVFDREGKEVAHASDTLDGKIPPNAVEQTLQQGIPGMQELQLKPGVYNVRVGVQDRVSQAIGTLEIPVRVQ